jgi:hypothetical protein
MIDVNRNIRKGIAASRMETLEFRKPLYIVAETVH